MTTTVRAILIDDETEARNALKGMLSEFCPEVQIIGEAFDLQSGLQLLNNCQADLLFLDVDLGQSQFCFDLLDQLQNQNLQIVFTTAHSEYALKAFNYQALNYLVKPIYSDDLIKTIHRVKKLISQNNPLAIDYRMIQQLLNNSAAKKTIAIPSKKQTIILDIEDIEYIEGGGSYSTYYLVDGQSYTISKNLKYFEENSTAADHFVRIHKSYLANKNHIVSISKSNGNFITMRSGTKLDITISYHSILEALNS